MLIIATMIKPSHAAKRVGTLFRKRLTAAGILSMTRGIFRVAAWFLLLAIVVLSVVPSAYRPVTPAPHNVEHLVIFFLTGLGFGLGYESRLFLQIIGLVAFSAAIELLQLYIPGRHARLSDFLVNAVSVALGVGLAALTAGRRSRHHKL
jgi:VanZ family protein